MEAAAVYCPRRDTGVDLGTTFSCVAVFEDGEIFVIPNDAGSSITPSVVFVPDANSSDIVVGEAEDTSWPEKDGPRLTVLPRLAR